jgi:competence protein ComEA
MKNLMLLMLLLFVSNVMATPVNINSADAKSIADALSGIGIKKADAIVKYRTEKGAFNAVEDLSNVKGIGQKTLDKNRKDILLSDTPVADSAAVVEPKAAGEPKVVTESAKATKSK